MRILGKKKVVLLGMMSRMPVAGVVWQTIHYLVGLRRLGIDTYYVEAHGCTPATFMETEGDDGAGKAANFIARVAARFDLEERWAYHAVHGTGRTYGMSELGLNSLYESADLIVNLHGGTVPLPEHYARGRLIYLETDPVQLQVELHDNLQTAIDFLAPHAAFFTFGENYGKKDCRLPVAPRFPFLPTRQPVVRDLWSGGGNGARSAMTTIANWRQANRDVCLNGEIYVWSKHREFLKFLDLPRRTCQKFELALCRCERSDRELLEGNAWKVRPADHLSGDIDAYRRYIHCSRGEFTVAKDQNIRLRTGWFSDRSATYLAAARPVITQETGFSGVLPTGEGLFGFSTMEEILQAVDAINSDYDRHCRAAAEIAASCFDHEVVLRKLLSEVGL